MSRKIFLQRAVNRCLVFIAVGALLIGRPAGAQDYYLPTGKPDVLTLLPLPPVADSAEQAADLAETVAAHKSCTSEDKARAESEEKGITLFTFTTTLGAGFQPDKLPKTVALFDDIQKETERVVDAGKDHWQRLRPYQVDPADLHHGEKTEKKPSFSYPSGHSTRGTVTAMLLAELYPDKRDAILAEGRQIGWDRVLLGRHYETDVFAGRVLGQAIVRQLHENPAFEHDFVAAKAEIAASAPKSPTATPPTTPAPSPNAPVSVLKTTPAATPTSAP